MTKIETDKHVLELSKTYFGLSISRWIVLILSSILLLYSSIVFIGAIVTYSQGYNKAAVVTIVNRDLLSVIFCASILNVITAIVGILATLRKDRHLLACHTLLLWPCLALLTTIAYLAYRDTIWDLQTWLGMKWRYDLLSDEHDELQKIFHCCGFQNSADHAVYRSTCSHESLLQGCHQKLYAFESYFLVKAYSICFGLVPLHVIVIITALVYSRPSMPWLGRYYGNPTVKSPSLDNQVVEHEHEPSNKPIERCLACENWTF